MASGAELAAVLPGNFFAAAFVLMAVIMYGLRFVVIAVKTGNCPA